MQATITNIENDSLFNPERKVEYLTDQVRDHIIQEKTSTSYARIFGITKKNEEKFNRDLAEFTLPQMEQVFFDFGAKNRNTIESYGRIISSYLNWNVKKGYSKENILAAFRPSDFEKYLVNNEVYLSEEELRMYENRCVNAQDAVILRLLFEGLGGKELSEIRNLKKNHVDVDNSLLYLQDEKSSSGRIPSIDVDPYTIKLVQEASKQMIYQKSNGKIEDTEFQNVRAYTDLVDNDYILRASITKNGSFTKPVDKFVVYRRIDNLARILEIENLTAKYLQRSGMIHRAKKLMKNGELSLSDIKNVAERFNIKSYHNLKGFLTTENVKKVYGED